MIVAFIVSVVCLVVDQLTKLWLYGKSCSLIGDFLWLEPGFNTGASFSIFSNATLFLALFSIPIMALMIYAIVSNKISKSKFFKISLGFILGGTLGNFIDRIFLKGVRDFIYFKSINFAIFNFADVFINIGAYMLFGFVIFCMVKEYKQKKLASKKLVDGKNTDDANQNGVSEQNVCLNDDEKEEKKSSSSKQKNEVKKNEDTSLKNSKKSKEKKDKK